MEGKEYRESIELPKFESELVEIDADCPVCGNRNRKVRRACKGPCGRTGTVRKIVPVSEVKTE